MNDPPADAPRGRRPGPPQPNMTREIVGSVIGAVLGATVAQLFGAEKEVIVSGAIAGSFVGPGLLAAIRRGWRNRRGAGDRP
jgi:uncharacterized protein YcfJ